MWAISVLRADWGGALEALQPMLAMDDPVARFRARMASGLVALHLGKLSEMRQHFAEAAAPFETGHPLRRQLADATMNTLLTIPIAAESLELAELEIAIAPPEERVGALFTAAQAHAILGNAAQAEENALEVGGASDVVIDRARGQIEATLAIAAGDLEGGAASLERVLDGVPSGLTSDNLVAARHELGVALWELGRHDDAAEQFRLFTGAHSGRINLPVFYVRSLYYLGAYHRDRGDDAEARDYFERLLAHWGDGELDLDRVAEARAFLSR